jgi:hypothetical protein
MRSPKNYIVNSLHVWIIYCLPKIIVINLTELTLHFFNSFHVCVIYCLPKIIVINLTERIDVNQNLSKSDFSC